MNEKSMASSIASVMGKLSAKARLKKAGSKKAFSKQMSNIRKMRPKTKVKSKV